MSRLEPSFAEIDSPTGLEQLLAAKGLLTAESLGRAQMVKAETGDCFVSVVTRLGLVSEQALAEALAEATGLRIANENEFPSAPIQATAAVSAKYLRATKAAPVRQSARGVEVAFADPLDRSVGKALALAINKAVIPVIGRASDIEAALERAYGEGAAEADADEVNDSDLERLADLASDAPAIRAVHRLMTAAVEAGASDIHFEPTENELQVRLRVDGAMRELPPLPASMKAAVVSRIKVMAALNIAEKRMPQDGRSRITVRGHDIDLRVATSPTIYGEAVVLRLLDRSRVSLDFDALGFDRGLSARFNELLARPHGIVLVTGPTGSGKTTTLYAALSAVNSRERKLLTIEDPIEYRLAGISQTQVMPSIGLTFATALRSFLRQDPDIMMVGEIRDLETAQVAVQAALTGHMILSTLHTNSAAAAVTRLIDMGVEPFLISSTLNAVLAQRLVRKLCVHCRRQTSATAWTAVGCEECRGAGYLGRVAIGELLVVDEAISQLILKRSHALEIEAAAITAGMRTMLQDGVAKVSAGLTTTDEVLRVTRESEA